MRNGDRRRRDQLVMRATTSTDRLTLPPFLLCIYIYTYVYLNYIEHYIHNMYMFLMILTNYILVTYIEEKIVST